MTSFVVVVGALAFMSLLGRIIQTWLKHREMARRERAAKELAQRERERELDERLEQQQDGYFRMVRELREVLDGATSPTEPVDPDVYLNGSLCLEGEDNDYWWGEDGLLRFAIRLQPRDILQVRGERTHVRTIEVHTEPGTPIVLGDTPPPAVPKPLDPPEGFVKVNPTVKVGDIVTHIGEECYAAEVVHQIKEGEYLTWAKLSPVPLPKTALDRLLDEDEVV